MKKAISLILALMMCLSLCACGGEKASVHIGDESFTQNEFQEIVNNNNFKFRNSYVGKSATVTGKITKIDGAYINSNLGHKFNAVITIDGKWCFEVSKSNPILENANVGDVVTATGTISTNLGFQVFCYGNATIVK